MRNHLGSLDLTDTGLSTVYTECVDTHASGHYTSLFIHLIEIYMYYYDSVFLALPSLVSLTTSLLTTISLSPPPLCLSTTLYTLHEQFCYVFSRLCPVHECIEFLPVHDYFPHLGLRTGAAEGCWGVCVACPMCLGCLNTFRTLHVSQYCSPP